MFAESHADHWICRNSNKQDGKRTDFTGISHRNQREI